MTIQEVRAKFPQYSDMSDQELADALHTKYYSDMPRLQFYKEIGMMGAKPVTPAPTSHGVTGSWDATKNEIPELAGGVVGGLMTAKRSTPVGMAVAGLGGAGGEAFRQIYQHVTSSPEAPQTSGEAAKKIASAGVTQALGEGGGRLLFGTISKLIAPFKKTVVPELKKANTMLKKVMGKDVGLTPAQITESHKVDVIESVAEQSWTGGDTIKAHRILQNEGYKVIEESILNDLNQYAAKFATPEEVGMMFRYSKAAKDAVYKRLASIKYKKVDQLAQGVGVDLVPLKKVAEEMMEVAEKRKFIGSTAAKDALLKKVLELDDRITFQEAQSLRHGFMEELTGADIGKGMVKKFTGLVDNAMEAGAKRASPEAYIAWRDANRFYKGYKELFSNDFMRNLDKIANNAPNKVVASVFRNGASTQIRNVKNVVKPATFNKLKTAYTEQLFTSAERTEGMVSGSALQSKLRSMGESALKEIYNPVELRLIKDFAATGAALQKKVSGGGGMLIQLMQAGALLSIGGGAVTGSPGAMVSGGAILLGPHVLAKMLINPTFSRMLTIGLKLPKGSKAAMIIGSKLAATAAKIQAEGD